jgi:ABC-type lipoprotein release transport system permease subunit
VLILRAFGLVKSKIIKLFIIEICFIIFIASIISFIIAHGIAFALNKFLFNFEIFTISETPVYITISVLIVVIIFAYLVSGSIVKGSLKEMLGDK